MESSRICGQFNIKLVAARRGTSTLPYGELSDEAVVMLSNYAIMSGTRSVRLPGRALLMISRSK